MFCLLFTIPADKIYSECNQRVKSMPSLGKKIITWILVFIWLFLISFAFVAATEPSWFKKLATIGRTDESRSLSDYGDNFLRQENYRMAIAQYQKALEIKPDHTGALVNMAIAYSLSGKHDVGLQFLKDALAATTNRNGTIFFNMADILRRQGKYEEAIDYYKKTLNSEVEQDQVYQRLGTLYHDMGRLDDARIALEKTLEIQTDLTTPFIKMLKRSMPCYSDDTENLKIIEGMLEKKITVADLGAYDLITIENIINSDPEIVKTHNYLGVIYSAQGYIDKAIDHFERSLYIWPGNEDARKNLQILKQLKQQESQSSKDI